MAKKIVNSNVIVILAVLTGFMIHSMVLRAGNTEPPGPPGPTMKTLDEVEPRMPIPGSTTPTLTYAIRNPGSYYLTGNRIAENGGILIETDGVTIDLMGYTLTGSHSRTDQSGISMNGLKNIEIRNGTVKDFHWGIREQSTNGKHHRIINVRVMSNTFRGIELNGRGHLVKDCTVGDNGTDGIHVENACTVTGNTVCDNGSSGQSYCSGIHAGNACVIVDNMVYDNCTSPLGYYVWAIRTGSSCRISANMVYNNGHSSPGYWVAGIWTEQVCTVTDNVVCENGLLTDSDWNPQNPAIGINMGWGGLADRNCAYGNNTDKGGRSMIFAGGTVRGINFAP